MKTLRLHLWREWREHRATLLFLSLALPLLSGLAALRLPRRFVGDPWMACGLIAIFVAVVLAAVGGELLGRERRGAGLRWLERLPGGLGHAFAAKLGLHLATSAFAGLIGFACAQGFAWVRGRGEYLWTNELDVTLPLVAVLSAWTFACSAWALRGGTAILAAALVLGLGGYPVWNVLVEGYRPGTSELTVGTTLVALAGLGSGALAFLLGSRRGAGVGPATAFGLVPMLPLVAVGALWSLDRLEQRERIEPGAGDYRLYTTWVTEDGRTAFVCGSHEDRGWYLMPAHVLRVDLATGEWSSVVRKLEGNLVLSSPRENGLLRPTALVLNSYDPPQELVFSLLDGRPTTRIKDRTSWHPAGFGQWQWTPGSAEGRYYDPFLRRAYPESQVEADVEAPMPMVEVFIRPGRWLLARAMSWYLYDPDARAMEPLDLPYGRLLALLPDGRGLFEHFEKGIVCLDPTTGLEREVVVPDGMNLAANDWAFRAPGWDRNSPMSADGPVYFRTEWECDCHALDLETMTLRTILEPSEGGWNVASFPDGRILQQIGDSLVEIDLRSGARRTVFPPEPES